MSNGVSPLRGVILSEAGTNAGKTLILGQIPDDFHPDRYLVAGASCFYDREEVYDKWTSLTFPEEPYTTVEEIQQTDDNICRLAKVLVWDSVSSWNDTYCLSFSPRAWHVIVFPWMYYILQNMWTHQRRLEKLIERYGRERLTVRLLKDNIDWRFKYMTDYVKNGILNPVYDEWLSSRILEKVLPQEWQTEVVDRSRDRDRYRIPVPSYLTPQPAWKRWRRRIKSAAFGRCAEITGISLWQAIRIHLYLSRSHSGIARDWPRPSREQLGIKEEDFVCDVRLFVPQILVEYLERVAAYARETVPGMKRTCRRGASRLGSQQLWADENEKVHTAIAIDEGERIIGYQHGGHGYGTSSTDGFKDEVEFQHDAFITWGWKEMRSYGNKFIPLPSPLLSRHVNAYNGGGDDMVLVGTGMRVYYVRFGLLQPSHWVQYREDKLTFLRGLTQQTLQNLKYRPMFSCDGTLRDEAVVRGEFPNLATIRGPLMERMLKARLVIQDHLGTTLNRTLSANIPTVAFYRSEHFLIHDRVRPYFDRLRDVGIVHDAPESAARIVESIKGRTREWWHDPERQRAKDDWCAKFARADVNWWKQWREFLVNF